MFDENDMDIALLLRIIERSEARPFADLRHVLDVGFNDQNAARVCAGARASDFEGRTFAKMGLK